MSNSRGGQSSGQAVRREIVLAALAAGSTYAGAGLAGGVSERSVSRWMSEPSFARSVLEARTEQVNVTSGRLHLLATEAVAVLADSLGSEVSAERLKAVGLVLTWASRYRRDHDFEARLRGIEAQVGLHDSADPVIDEDPIDDRGDAEGEPA